MKLNAGKRFLMFLHWLASLLICAALVIHVVRPPFYAQLKQLALKKLNMQQIKIIALAALIVYAILVIIQLVIIFKRRKRADRGFIVVDSSESGRVRIAVPAIEQMVRQSVDNIEGISEMRIKIDSNDDAIDIGVNASIINGGHVPTITMNMQRAIRQFVEMNCGVAVHAVPISIKSVTAPAEGKRKGFGKGKESAAPAPAATPAPATEAPAQPSAWETAIANHAAEAEPEPAPVESAPVVEEPIPAAAPIAPWDSAYQPPVADEEETPVETVEEQADEDEEYPASEE